jgi:N-acetylmuramoyl-L-alanine amidase
MPDISETKARLLHGAVQDNVAILQGTRIIRQRQRARRRYDIWLLSAVLALGLVYLMGPALWRGPIWVQNSLPNAAAVANVEPVPETSVPLSHPRPIDRSAIPLSIKTIVIDPGHGGDPGAMAESGLTEKEVTLDVALRLRRHLSRSPFEVLLTRDADRRISLDQRVAFANERKADLFISIHVNSMEPHTIRALETYYVGPTDDPLTLKLASRENKDSEFSLADYKKILEKIYVDARRDESHGFARAVQGELFRSLKKTNPDLENRGVRTAPFVVLIGTQMPAVLVEIACLSNEEEVQLLTKPDYRENIAVALAQGIRQYADRFNVAARKGS